MSEIKRLWTFGLLITGFSAHGFASSFDQVAAAMDGAQPAFSKIYTKMIRFDFRALRRFLPIDEKAQLFRSMNTRLTMPLIRAERNFVVLALK